MASRYRAVSTRSITQKRYPSLWLGGLASLLCLSLTSHPAYATDPFHTRREVPATPGSFLMGAHAPCALGVPGDHLSFEEAIERALCANSDARDAWVAIEQAAAAVGISKAAYLPTRRIQL